MICAPVCFSVLLVCWIFCGMNKLIVEGCRDLHCCDIFFVIEGDCVISLLLLVGQSLYSLLEEL